jgi:GcrA cell cycle regulator
MPESLHLTIMQLESHTCKYPDGAPLDRPSTFCGVRCDNPLKPYCGFHLKLVYVVPDRRPRGERFAVKRNFDLPEVVA